METTEDHDLLLDRMEDDTVPKIPSDQVTVGAQRARSFFSLDSDRLIASTRSTFGSAAPAKDGLSVGFLGDNFQNAFALLVAEADEFSKAAVRIKSSNALPTDPADNAS